MSPAAGLLSSPSSLRTMSAAAVTTAAAEPEETAQSDTDAGSQTAETVPDLTGMTKAQLLATASELGIEGVSSRNTKAEIVAAIEAAEH